MTYLNKNSIIWHSTLSHGFIFSHVLWSFCANNAWGLGRFITTCFRYIRFDYLNKELETYRKGIKSFSKYFGRLWKSVCQNPVFLSFIESS